MNKGLLCKLLGLVAMLIGGSMAFSLPWAWRAPGAVWEHERAGFWALVGSMAICLVVAAALRYLGRKSRGRLFRKEAMAVVGLSWIMATVLGALPYALSGTHRAPGVRMSPVDAMFEAQSGFSTTGATVLTELEDPSLVPRCILFWRSSTHFLGGLGIIVLFVAILGQGSAGKALMRTEMPGPNYYSTQARMQHTAWVLFFIYAGLNGLLTLLLFVEGLSPFDALCHAFGTMATGGFSTYNASIGHFATVPGLNGPLIEMTIAAFMVLAGTNFTLMYFVLIRKPGRLLADVEWRTYIALLLSATALVVGIGLYRGDFRGTNGMQGKRTDSVRLSKGSKVRVGQDGRLDVILPDQNNHEAEESPDAEAAVLVPAGSEVCVGNEGQLDITLPVPNKRENAASAPAIAKAARYGLFQVVSIMTTTGFCTDDFDAWNSFGRGLLLLLMFVGGCAGSTGGGLKVIRHILFVKILRLEVEHAFHPTVVRPLRIGGQPVEDPNLRTNILVYFGLILVIFVASWLFTVTYEPAETWTNHGHMIEHKLIDGAGCVAATLNNIGPGLGVIGATKNYSNFTWPTKILFTWLMMIGRLEVFTILVLFFPAFWRSQ